MTTFQKDPDAVLDYAVDWSAWLVDGDTITSSEWLSDTLTITSPALSGAKATVWLSGGTAPGFTHRVTNRVRTAAGRVDDRSFDVYVVDR